jgi:hypothetical protein
MELPIIYGVSSKKIIKQWQVSAIENSDGSAILRKVYGQKDGKLQTNNKKIKGKNIGRSNETTPFQQACKEAEAAHKKKKREKNYTETIPDVNAEPEHLLPMLALHFKKRKHNISYPVKYKEFMDEEFEIIGGREGEGSDEGCVVLKCQVVGAGKFDVRPRGTKKHRRQMLKDLPKLIGKPYTVRFFGWTEDGIPQFPVGITCRDYE